MSAVGAVLEKEFEVGAGHSLRAKGLGLVAVLVLHLVCVAVVMMIQRANLLSEVSALGRLHAAVEALVVVDSHFGGDGGGEAVHRQLARRVDAAITDLREQRFGIESDLRRHADLTFGLILALEIITIATLAAAVLTYMRHVCADLWALTMRARDIGRGRAAGECCIVRRDELGQLARAMDAIRVAWLARESALELGRRRQSHRHTLDTLGALAQKVAHEIGNPLAGIVGVAQAIDEAKQVKHCRSNGATCHPEVILQQAERIVETSRQFADWSDLQRGEAGVLNVNDLVARTCGLLAFDRRLSGIQIRSSLSAALPAVDAAGDDVVQLLTWCLLDAAQRVEAVKRTSAWVEIRTCWSEGSVQLQVSDNGEAFASPAGLHGTRWAAGESDMHALCRALVEEMRGQAEFSRDNGVNLALFRLPHAPLSEHGGRG